MQRLKFIILADQSIVNHFIIEPTEFILKPQEAKTYYFTINPEYGIEPGFYEGKIIVNIYRAYPWS